MVLCCAPWRSTFVNPQLRFPVPSSLSERHVSALQATSSSSASRATASWCRLRLLAPCGWAYPLLPRWLVGARYPVSWPILGAWASLPMQPTKPLTTPAASGPARCGAVIYWHCASRFHCAAFSPSSINFTFFIYICLSFLSFQGAAGTDKTPSFSL